MCMRTRLSEFECTQENVGVFKLNFVASYFFNRVLCTLSMHGVECTLGCEQQWNMGERNQT